MYPLHWLLSCLTWWNLDAVAARRQLWVELSRAFLGSQDILLDFTAAVASRPCPCPQEPAFNKCCFRTWFVRFVCSTLVGMDMWVVRRSKTAGNKNRHINKVIMNEPFKNCPTIFIATLIEAMSTAFWIRSIVSHRDKPAVDAAERQPCRYIETWQFSRVGRHSYKIRLSNHSSRCFVYVNFLT